MGIRAVRAVTPFKAGLLLSSFFITAFLLCAIGSLLAVPTLEDVLTNIWNEEMQLSLKLSLATGIISTLLVMLFALPIGYTLSRLDFWGKGLVKTIIDLPVAFPELVLGLCLLLLFGKTPVGEALSALGLDFVFTKKGWSRPSSSRPCRIPCAS